MTDSGTNQPAPPELRTTSPSSSEQSDVLVLHTRTSSSDTGVAEWPTLTERTIVHWCSPHIDVVVEVGPGDDITASLIAAAQEEIALFAPVNVEEFDVTLEPSKNC